METKYTLGPWRKGARSLDITAKGKVIATVHCDSDHPATEAQAHANRDIMLAAPEMLEALQNIIEYRTPVPDTESDYVPRTIIKEVKQAILKALKG